MHRCFPNVMLFTSQTGLILGLHPADERRHYFVTTSLTVWAQAENQPCSNITNITHSIVKINIKAWNSMWQMLHSFGTELMKCIGNDWFNKTYFYTKGLEWQGNVEYVKVESNMIRICYMCSTLLILDYITWYHSLHDDAGSRALSQYKNRLSQVWGFPC